MAKLTLMQGLPASGKSTKAKEILITSGNSVRLNKDLLRTMLHFDKFNGVNEGHTQDAESALADFFLEHDLNVIIDDTNLNPKVVSGWKDLARLGEHKFEIVKMDTPIEECLKRDEARLERSVGPYVIKNMARQYRLFPNGKKDVIVDLDGTLADISHRLHFVQQAPKDWKGFFGAIAGDAVRKEVVDMIDPYCNTHNIVIVSARPEKYQAETVRWLFAHYLDLLPFDTIIMRRNGDAREDSEVKKDILDKYFDKTNVEIVFDDRPRVIRMWREEGLKVVDVGKGIDF